MHAKSPTTLLGGRRRISRWGIAFCAVYALIIVVCFAAAALGNFNGKSRYLLEQLPFVLQSALVWELGWSRLFSLLPGLVQYASLALPVFIGLYLLGVACSRASIFK